MATDLLAATTNTNNTAASQQQQQQIFNDNFNQLTQPISIEFDSFERAFWISVFSLMVLVATSGNCIVIYIVSTNKTMKSVTNYFLVNLSLADAMVSTLNVVFNFISMLNSHWPFGLMYCKVSNFIAIFSISASVFTLTAIACDRYTAILRPLRPRMRHSHALAWIVLIWLSSAVLAMPNAILSTTVSEFKSPPSTSSSSSPIPTQAFNSSSSVNSADSVLSGELVDDNAASVNDAITCTNIWPDGRYPNSKYDHIYNIVLFITTYFVPIVTMAVLYAKVGRELQNYEPIGENIEKQLQGIQAKKKIVKMMIVVVSIFALCWLPYHVFFILTYYSALFPDSPTKYQRSYFFMYWLAMSNSMYNPMIIYFMNSKFRREIRRILKLLCCCCSQYANRVTSPTRASCLQTTTTATSAHGRTLANNSSAYLQANQQQQLTSTQLISPSSSSFEPCASSDCIAQTKEIKEVSELLTQNQSNLTAATTTTEQKSKELTKAWI